MLNLKKLCVGISSFEMLQEWQNNETNNNINNYFLYTHTCHHFIIEKGRIVWQGDSRSLLDGSDVMSRYLGF